MMVLRNRRRKERATLIMSMRNIYREKIGRGEYYGRGRQRQKESEEWERRTDSGRQIDMD